MQIGHTGTAGGRAEGYIHLPTMGGSITRTQAQLHTKYDWPVVSRRHRRAKQAIPTSSRVEPLPYRKDERIPLGENVRRRRLITYCSDHSWSLPQHGLVRSWRCGMPADLVQMDGLALLPQAPFHLHVPIYTGSSASYDAYHHGNTNIGLLLGTSPWPSSLQSQEPVIRLLPVPPLRHHPRKTSPPPCLPSRAITTSTRSPSRQDQRTWPATMPWL